MKHPWYGDFHRHRAHFREVLKLLVTPRWFLLLMIFFAFYVPFLVQYGWGYRDLPNVDLPTFYAASVSVFERGESPYNNERLTSLMKNDVYVLPYLYPPPSLLLFFPLSAMTYTEGRHALLIINHLFFVILVWAIPLHLLRLRPNHALTIFAVCVVYLLTFYPVVMTLNHGQVSILLLAFLVLFWLLARRGNALLAGMFLALAVLLKTYPVMIILLLLLIGRWREGMYTIAWLGLAMIVSFAVLPITLWQDWLTNIFPSVGYMQTPEGLFSPAAVWNQSLNGFFARTFTVSEWSRPASVNPDLARVLTYGSALFTAAVTSAAAWRSRIFTDSLDRTLIVALPAMFLIAPYSWEHHLVYLLPSILILLKSRSPFTFVPKTIFISLSIASAILMSMPDLLEFKFFGVLALWALSVFVALNGTIELMNKPPDACSSLSKNH